MHTAGDFFGLPYDFKSVMHYSQYQQSRNGKVTIQTLDTNMQKVRLDFCYCVKRRTKNSSQPDTKENLFTPILTQEYIQKCLENPLSGYWAVERDQCRGC